MIKANGIKITLIFLAFLFRTHAATVTPDTLKVNIHEVDSIFLNRNISLLVAGLNIDQKKAEIIQAKLYPNLVFSATMNAYDPENKRAFHWGATGQQVYQLEQLILLGGKRKADIDIAKSQVKMAEYEFEELLKNLKFQLHSGFYILSQKKAIIDKYDEQINLLSAIISGYEIQAKKGNFPLKDVVRLKGMSLNIRAEKAELIREYADYLLNLQLLLQTDQVIFPVEEGNYFEKLVKPFDINDLVQLAFDNRPDYKNILQQENLAALTLSREKKMAIPDLTVFGNYDQRSGAFNNELNLGISVPLPIWNRNQGNIKVAEISKQQAKLTTEQYETQLKTEVKMYLSMYNRAVRDYQVSNELFSDDFELTAKGMLQSFQKGNVSLIEFVDFFESYNDALGDFANIKAQLGIAAEQLILKVGTDIFK